MGLGQEPVEIINALMFDQRHAARRGRNFDDACKTVSLDFLLLQSLIE